MKESREQRESYSTAKFARRAGTSGREILSLMLFVVDESNYCVEQSYMCISSPDLLAPL